jgi:hypothetical protein
LVKEVFKKDLDLQQYKRMPKKVIALQKKKFSWREKYCYVIMKMLRDDFFRELSVQAYCVILTLFPSSRSQVVTLPSRKRKGMLVIFSNFSSCRQKKPKPAV